MREICIQILLFKKNLKKTEIIAEHDMKVIFHFEQNINKESIDVGCAWGKSLRDKKLCKTCCASELILSFTLNKSQ